MNPSASIGIFDSGFGGLTVMRTIMRALPKENIVYFGDTARLPYGNKSRETIIRYSLENAQFLMEHGVKALVIACHTACSMAFEAVLSHCPIPVIGVIPAAIEEAITHSSQGNIAVIGTRGTIQSGVYQQEIVNRFPDGKVHAIPCPLFVPLIEEGFIEHPLTALAIREYLSPLKKQDVESLILGCTHYPLIASVITRELNCEYPLIDPAQGCATQLYNLLEQNQAHNPQTTPSRYEFYVSDDPEKFRTLGPAYLGHPIHIVSQENSREKICQGVFE